MSNLVMTWGPAVLWAGVLFLLSHQSDLPGSLDLPLVDKVGHLALYGVFGWTLARGWSRSGGPHAAILAVGLLYAASDEIHQSFVPGRFPSAGDFLADGLGLALGYYLTLKLASTPRRTSLRPAAKGGD